MTMPSIARMRSRFHGTSFVTTGLTACLTLTALPAADAEKGTETPAITNGASDTIDIDSLDIEQLSQVRIVSATLTPTLMRLIPAKTTDLDATTIAQSGARTLNELLEIYTPNSQLIRHNTHMAHFGLRGIISDRDDKYLLRVNGKVMNNRMFVGSESERGLPLLGDFRSVTVVHGPASATYGAGALAGVISLETYTGLTFEGTDVQIRQGFQNQFTAGEWRFGHKLSNDSGVFFYIGAADQSGSDQHDSPYVFGKSFATPGPTPDVVSGEPVSFDVPNLDDGGDILKLKVHASYVTGPVELWTRFTQDGGVMRDQRSVLQSVDNSLTRKGRKSENQQFTIAGKYKQNLSADFNLETFTSYSRYLYRLWLYDQYSDSDDRLEEEAFVRVLGTWTPTKRQSMALGMEYSHMWFDGPPVGYGPGPGLPPAGDVWQTNMISLLSEHQWQVLDQWTTFASARADKHTYTDWLLSPRLALAYTPTRHNTIKLIGARAIRRNGDGELRQEHVQTNERGSKETLDSIELRDEWKPDENWHIGCGAFIERNDAIGFNAAANHSVRVGTFTIWGIEPEIAFRSRDTRVTLSHGYTKLISVDLETPTTVQGISAAPYGYGHDLANWSNHITKLAVNHNVTSKWSVSTSLRVYWGFPGARDLAAWNGSQATPSSYALNDPGYDKAYGPSVYWNTGLEYRPAGWLTLRVDAYNILGWFDQTLNKRLHYSRGSDYSVEAAATALTAKMTF